MYTHTLYLYSYVRLPEGKVLPGLARAALTIHATQNWWLATNRSSGIIPSGFRTKWHCTDTYFNIYMLSGKLT